MSTNAEWFYVGNTGAYVEAAEQGETYGDAHLEHDEFGVVIGADAFAVVYSTDVDDLVAFFEKALAVAHAIKESSQRPA